VALAEDMFESWTSLLKTISASARKDSSGDNRHRRGLPLTA
jgi:hypothetical protein